MSKENNRMIAEFMNAEMTVTQFGMDGHPFNTSLYKYEKPRDNWPYDTSWGWLMEVVEKVESIYHDRHGYFGVYISSNSCTIQGTKFRSDTIEQDKPAVYFHNVVLGTKLEATYNAIVSFIKWYNKNIKTENNIKEYDKER